MAVMEDHVAGLPFAGEPEQAPRQRAFPERGVEGRVNVLDGACRACPLTRNHPVTQADQHGEVEETQEVCRVLPSARVRV
jgi:hypothetical protein